MKLIIDRIEKDHVICEKPDKTMLELEISLFPSEIKEGDCMDYDPAYGMVVDKKMRQEREKSITERMHRLMGK